MLLLKGYGVRLALVFTVFALLFAQSLFVSELFAGELSAGELPAEQLPVDESSADEVADASTQDNASIAEINDADSNEAGVADPEVSYPASTSEIPDKIIPLHPSLSLEERFNQAEWVSLVRVEGISTLINPMLSQANRFSAIEAFNYRAAVLKDWKGQQPASIKFRVDLTDCRQPLAAEGEYIVFGLVNLQGNYQSMSCDDIIAFDRESGVPASLDRFSLSWVSQVVTP